MPFIGNQPAKVPLTSADITDGIIVNADINTNAAIASSKLSITSPLSITGNSTAGSEIRLPEDTDNGSNYVALKAADNIASNLTFTLPSADGSANQALITNGSGSLSFATVGAAAGQVIQVVSATDSTARSTTSTTFVSASNTLSLSITPSSTSNKILILVHATAIWSANNSVFLTVFRGATNLGDATYGFSNQGDGNLASGGTVQHSVNYLDSPSTTSATTYEVRIRTSEVSYSHTINRQAKSSITLLEIKG
jgi:hypothetical protein